MRAHEIVKYLEDDCEAWENLTGEIMATLSVNLERGLISAEDPLKLAQWISRWAELRAQLQASRASIGNIRFDRTRLNVRGSTQCFTL